MHKGIQLGEIHVPGGSGTAGAKTFVLTKPAQPGEPVELLFGLFAAEAPRKIIEKLADRLAEEARPVFFGASGSSEERFEMMLKQLNRAILGFLHEHHLSIPGIRLRGAIGAVVGNELMLSSRGRLRGILAVPTKTALQPYDLFDDSADHQTNPKFFVALQSGTLPPGSRLYVSSAELFETLDEPFVKEAFSEPDETRVTRDLKAALKSSRLPVSVMSLMMPGGDPMEAPVRSQAPIAKPQAKPKPQNAAQVKAQTDSNMADIGEMVARGIRMIFFGLGSALKLLPRFVIWLFRSLTKAVTALPALARGVIAVFHPERRKLAFASVAVSHERFIDHHVGRLNAMTPGGRARALFIVLCGALLVHGTIFSALHHASAAAVQQFDARIAEFEQLKTELESTLIYSNDARAAEIASRMKTLVDTTPADSDAHARVKTSMEEAYAAALERVHKITTLDQPKLFASLDAASDAYRGGSLAVFEGTLYLFSPTKSSALVFSVDGSFTEKEILKAPASAGAGAGYAAAAPGNTGLVLEDASGNVIYWNPKTGETQPYEGALPAGPMMYWQNRLYTLGDGGSITRRALAAKKLGAPAESVPAGNRPAISSLAADGAVYFISGDGHAEKFMKGAAIGDFRAPAIEPAPASAADLWASPDYDRLLFIDKGGDRLFMLDKKSGALIGQYKSPALTGLEAMAVNPDTGIIHLMAAGKIYAVPMDLPRP